MFLHNDKELFRDVIEAGLLIRIDQWQLLKKIIMLQ